MTRRTWLLSLSVVPLLRADDPVNPFVAAWNEWAKVANKRAERNPGGFDWREPGLWEQVKREWKKIKTILDGMYRK